MVQWIFQSELDRARHLYLDAYMQVHGVILPRIPSKQWGDLLWLEAETDELIVEWAKAGPTSMSVVSMDSGG